MESQYAKDILGDISLNVAPLKTAATLDENTGYPYTVTLDNIIGFAALNQHATNTVTFTITLSDATVFTIPILASGAYTGEYESVITTIAVAGTTPDFAAELMRRVS